MLTASGLFSTEAISMQPRRFAAWIAICLAALPSASAHGQFVSPISQKSYRVLPRLSTLLVDYPHIDAPIVPWQVRGTFDFRIDPSPLAVAIFPPVFNASFIEPDVWATHPVLDIVIDVDETFNLAELTGSTNLRFPRYPRLFQFRGTNDEGDKVRLDALVAGRWLYMRGHTELSLGIEAPAASYHLRAIARVEPSGDLNGDGIVDREDLRLWRDRPDRSGSDLLEWQRGLGDAPPSLEEFDAQLAAALAGAVSAVPEPGSVTLLALAGAALAALRRRSSR
jgi:hypothetical protein